MDNMKDSPLDTMDMDFTPSEIDDLETIQLPNSEQPKDFWTIRRKDSGVRMNVSRLIFVSAKGCRV